MDFLFVALTLFEKKSYFFGSVYVVLSAVFCILGVLLGKRLAMLLN